MLRPYNNHSRTSGHKIIFKINNIYFSWTLAYVYNETSKALFHGTINKPVTSTKAILLSIHLHEHSIVTIIYLTYILNQICKCLVDVRYDIKFFLISWYIIPISQSWIYNVYATWICHHVHASVVYSYTTYLVCLYFRFCERSYRPMTGSKKQYWLPLKKALKEIALVQ